MNALNYVYRYRVGQKPDDSLIHISHAPFLLDIPLPFNDLISPYVHLLNFEDSFS